LLIRHLRITLEETPGYFIPGHRDKHLAGRGRESLRQKARNWARGNRGEQMTG